MITIGQLGLAVGLLGVIGAFFALFIGHASGKSGQGSTRAGYYLTMVGAVGFTLATVVLTAAFFAGDYSIRYVALQHATETGALKWLFSLSGLWAGREGSLLFWTWLMTLFSVYMVFKSEGPKDKLTNVALTIMNAVVSLFGLSMVMTSVNNPFLATEAFLLSPTGELIGAAANWGMNPLLQHWAMILHPPTLFIGYAGFAVPFAYGLAALIIKDSSDRWVAFTDRITLFAWLFLGAGIGLGAVWAYVVLDWGGYWGWDPVENASILPWFVGLALIHSFTMYRRRGGFKKWAVMLSALTFSMAVFGTFITRTGLVGGVHAFTDFEPVSFWVFLLLILVPVALTGALLLRSGKTFAGADEFENLSGREAAYYFNNVLMTIASLLIAYLTVAAALPEWMPLGGRSVGGVAYELIARPIGVLYMFILALCPLMSWGKTEGKSLWSKLKWPLAATAALFAVLLVEWWVNLRPVWDFMVELGGDPSREFTAFGPQIVYDVIAVLSLFIASLTIMTNGALFVRGTRARMKAMGENVLQAFGAVLVKARKQSGGYVSHIAMGLIVIGLVGSSMYVRDVTVKFEGTPGSTVEVGEYTFEFTGAESVERENGDREDFYSFDVFKGAGKVGTASPSVEKLVRAEQPSGHAWVIPNPIADIFVSFQSFDPATNTGSINVKVNPLIWLVWGGFSLLLIGTALASWPSRRRAA